MTDSAGSECVRCHRLWSAHSPYKSGARQIKGADDNRPATALLPARVGTRALVPKAT